MRKHIIGFIILASLFGGQAFPSPSSTSYKISTQAIEAGIY